MPTLLLSLVVDLIDLFFCRPRTDTAIFPEEVRRLRKGWPGKWIDAGLVCQCCDELEVRFPFTRV